MGKEYWRSLDELADTPEFRSLVEKEFPGLAEELLSPQTRRAFLKVMGASRGVAGLAACRWPKETILPFARGPEGRIPGAPQQFATAMDLGGAAIGLLVTSFDGRPVKVEGNPLHPISRGAATAFAQASILELYDPDRSKQVLRREGGQVFASSWDEFAAFAGPHFAELRARKGAGLAVLSEGSSSPSLTRLRTRFAEVFPQARWFEWEPVERDNEREAEREIFGAPCHPQLRFDKADVVVCLDADPLFDHPAAVAHARDFASRRRAEGGTMNRLWCAESVLSLTGAAADHRAALTPHGVEEAARLLASAVLGVEAGAPQDAAAGRFAAAAARDLHAARGRCLVLAGPRQPVRIHLLAHALNAALGAEGTTVSYVEDIDPSRGPHLGGILQFSVAADRGEIRTLVVLGGNPAYTAPGAEGVSAAIAKIPVSVRLGLFDDETSRVCGWHLPRAHSLESWGDALAWDGTWSVQQPLIDAMYDGRTPAELIAVFVGEAASAHEIARETLKAAAPAGGFEAFWRRTLHDGVAAGVAALPAATPPAGGRLRALAEAALAEWEQPSAPASGITAVFVPDARVHDGRFANNAWLQEMPDPLTKITWDNAALLSPKTADSLGVRHGDVVRVKRGERALEIVAYVMPGQADDTVVLPLGYGRTAAGKVGTGVGFNAYALRTPDALYFAGGVTVEKTGRTHGLACTQDHQAIDKVGYEARGQRIADLVREGTLAELVADPEFVRKKDERPVLPVFESPKLIGEHQWAMSIDLSACIGCNACTIACQAENNIAVVGKEQVLRGREMHWIRVDRYFSGKPETPKVAFQPMACQHCENAPCEQVCPVAATIHSDEGLNEQVYNRCVGTRYCSNNCPYKVRRFNFFNYVKNVPETEKMAFNPEVTVRGRGVMEKCSFCVQRIEAVKIAAKNDRRPIKDGDVVPACAQTCPTQAIVFGDLKDAASRVSKLREDRRSYPVLGELNTKPRTTYLAKLRNPSSKVEEG